MKVRFSVAKKNALALLQDETLVDKEFFSDRLLNMKPLQRRLVLTRMLRQVRAMDASAELLSEEASRLVNKVFTSEEWSHELQKRIGEFKGKIKSFEKRFFKFCNFGESKFKTFSPTSDKGRYSKNYFEARTHLVGRKLEALMHYVAIAERDLAMLKKS